MAPTWLPKGSQNRPKKASKNYLEIDTQKCRLFYDFNQFLDETWSQIGTKIAPKIDSNSKQRIFENRALARAGARFSWIWTSNFKLKID